MARPTVGNHAAPLKERKDDLYETPPEATHALLRCEPLPRRILEPCCGPGAIVKVLREAGHQVIAQDLVDYGCPDSAHSIDFLMEFRLPEADAIVTNPPFKLAAEFIRKGLDMCPLVIILQRLMFIEGQGRSDIIDGHLTRIHCFRNRLPTMHRHGWDGPKTGSMVPYAWFVFEREKNGPTLMDRISWEPLPVTPATSETAMLPLTSD
jgi:hypothetical protein